MCTLSWDISNALSNQAVKRWDEAGLPSGGGANFFKGIYTAKETQQPGGGISVVKDATKRKTLLDLTERDTAANTRQKQLGANGAGGVGLTSSNPTTLLGT